MNNWMRSLRYVMVAFFVIAPIFGLQLANADVAQKNPAMSVQKEQSDTNTQLKKSQKGPMKLMAKEGKSVQLKRDPRGLTELVAKEGKLEIKCNGSCLCKGAGDCVNLVFSGCCSGAITCDDSGCSCVNGAGCDNDGNLPD